MIRLFDNPKFQTAMMLICAACAWDDARVGNKAWAYTMIVCACWWMFRLWGGLRAQDEGREQS